MPQIGDIVLFAIEGDAPLPALVMAVHPWGGEFPQLALKVFSPHYGDHFASNVAHSPTLKYAHWSPKGTAR